MPVTHIVTAGMGGMRTAGDLVAWMQMTRKMKLADAKSYVAKKLGVDVMDLVDEDVMYRLRKELGIGTVTPEAGGPEGILAKCRVADLLDIEINSVNRFESQLSSLRGHP
jgi:dimethylamine--corrinoid protein Co-methyltransferase